MTRQIILASTSPRRQQVIKLLGFKVQIIDSGYEEIINPKLKCEDLVKFLALGKAKTTAEKYPKAVIISADTMVLFNGKIIGKPENKNQAISMLKSFSGKAQSVMTGTVVLDATTKQVVISVTKTIITFKKLSTKEILSYVNSGEPYDKAGGYNLQGLGFNLISNIQGDFTNVLGLPMVFVFNALKKLGVKV